MGLIPMPKPTTKIVEFLVAAEVTINDPEALAEHRKDYIGLTRLSGDEETYAHLAYNCLANDQENARLLDGWADLPPEAVQMRRVISPTEYELYAVSDPENSRLARTP